jgi:hypothetical protein
MPRISSEAGADESCAGAEAFKESMFVLRRFAMKLLFL